MPVSTDSKNEQPCWIDSKDPSEAGSELEAMYERVGAVHGKIHNLYRAFSLQPKPLLAADRHYRDILHNPDNQSLPWFLELLASQAAIIADCHYALANHQANFKSLLGDAEKAEKKLEALRNDAFDDDSVFSPKESALLRYGAKLCRSPE